ncbi:MAG: hypothetical protein H0T79_06250 [Deltaproteobacteria bacterium]|nr:hypothetical protein [Deltaproteobacteria bacterium]
MAVRLRSCVLGSFALLASLTVAKAHADVRGVLRLGVLPLDVESSPDTPLFGDDVDRAVRAYNAAATAYDRAHGSATTPLTTSALGLSETLFTISPGIEAGTGPYFFRLEGMIGLGADLRSYGVGVYPLNLQTMLGREVAGYVSAGGTASVLDETSSGASGGLVTLRLAAGVRLAERIVIELGFSAFVLGGVVDTERLQTMSMYDPRGETPPPAPDGAVEAGSGRGLVDVSVGLTF